MGVDRVDRVDTMSTPSVCVYESRYVLYLYLQVRCLGRCITNTRGGGHVHLSTPHRHARVSTP